MCLAQTNIWKTWTTGPHDGAESTAVSTYYNFKCPVCKEQGGFFSRQAWGSGSTHESARRADAVPLHQSRNNLPALLGGQPIHTDHYA
jgi:phage FluMu protein Com